MLVALARVAQKAKVVSRKGHHSIVITVIVKDENQCFASEDNPYFSRYK